MPLGKYWVRSRRGYQKRIRDMQDRIYRKPGYYTSRKVATGRGLKVAKSQNTKLATPLLPLSKVAKLPYYDQNNFTTGIVLAGGYVFTANGLYDPNITGVGHQPMGFDQMMLFYEHYTVTASKITVNFYNNDVDDAVIVGVLVAPDATVETVFSKLNENGMLKKHWLTPSGGTDPKCSITLAANISKINGKKDVKSEDDFRGDVAANPAEQSFFHLFAYNQTTTNTVNVVFEVMIEYTAIFTEPRKMTQS